MACTQWSYLSSPLPPPPPPPSSPCTSFILHCTRLAPCPCPADSLATVAKTRSLIISSKAKDKPDQADRRRDGQATLGPWLQINPIPSTASASAYASACTASFLAFCVISLKTKTENGSRTMVRRNPAQPAHNTRRARVCPLQLLFVALAALAMTSSSTSTSASVRRPHVPQRLINL